MRQCIILVLSNPDRAEESSQDLLLKDTKTEGDQFYEILTPPPQRLLNNEKCLELSRHKLACPNQLLSQSMLLNSNIHQIHKSETVNCRNLFNVASASFVSVRLYIYIYFVVYLTIVLVTRQSDQLTLIKTKCAETNKQ